MTIQQTDSRANFDNSAKSLPSRRKRNTPDLRAAVERTTRAEALEYAALRAFSFTLTEPKFLAAGYIVVNATDIPSKRHGRRKSHRANLVRKQLIVPLSPSRSRQQLYLIGCVYEGESHYVLWLDEIFAWGRHIDLPCSEAPREASIRAIRPTRRETPQMLMDKGFVPLRPRAAQISLHLITN